MLYRILFVFIWAGLLLGPVPRALAGPVLGGGPDSEAQLTDRPDSKPMKCIGPVNMSNGMVLPKGKFVGSIKYRYVHKDSLYDGGQKKNGSYGGKYDRVNQSLQLALKAGLFDGFEARLMVPFWDKRVKRKPGNLAKPWDSNSQTGVGDAVVMGRYALMRQKKGAWCNLAVGAGLKLPTGDADAKNRPPYSNAHAYLGPGGQLGTGSWDPKFELGATKFVGRSRFDAHFMYTLATDGAHDSRKGDQFKYNFGYGYALNRLFDLELELNGVNQSRHIYDGEIAESTGGHTVYLTPGIHWKITDKSHFSVGMPLVIYRDLNGYSATPDRNSRYGLGEDYQIVTRLGFSF